MMEHFGKKVKPKQKNQPDGFDESNPYNRIDVCGFDKSNPYNRVENKDTGNDRKMVLKSIVDASRLDLSSPFTGIRRMGLMNQTPTIGLMLAGLINQTSTIRLIVTRLLRV
jgi:hypothetical protein